MLSDAIFPVRTPGGSTVRDRTALYFFFYYPLGVDAEERDSLRHHLLRRGVDTKRTDMADCTKLAPFRGAETDAAGPEPAEAALLEICVYPGLADRKMRKIAQAIREWATP